MAYLSIDDIGTICTEVGCLVALFSFFSSRRRHTRLTCDWSSDVCSSDLLAGQDQAQGRQRHLPQRLTGSQMCLGIRLILASEALGKVPLTPLSLKRRPMSPTFSIASMSVTNG